MTAILRSRRHQSLTPASSDLVLTLEREEMGEKGEMPVAAEQRWAECVCECVGGVCEVCV